MTLFSQITKVSSHPKAKVYKLHISMSKRLEGDIQPYKGWDIDLIEINVPIHIETCHTCHNPIFSWRLR